MPDSMLLQVLSNSTISRLRPPPEFPVLQPADAATWVGGLSKRAPTFSQLLAFVDQNEVGFAAGT